MASPLPMPGVSPPPVRGRRQQGSTVYPHRSVRSLSLSRFRILAGLAAAAGISFLVAANAASLMHWHSVLVGTLCQIAGLPVSGWVPVEVFPALGPGTAPVLAIPAFAEVSDGARLGLILSIAGLLMAAGRFSLFRNLAYFLIALLCASALASAVFDSFRLQSVEFGQIWLRQEALVWILSPWVLLLLFVMAEPAWARGLAWVAFLLAYGFVFSALRMVFVLGLLHFTGLLFMPVLWFVFGTLSDLLYVLFFYSISVNWTSGELWGERSAWRSHF